jgi:bacteriocin biosynthesis cyclodehydratase domain-containing protein
MRVHILTAGRFGHAVAGELAKLRPDVVEVCVGAAPPPLERWPASDAIVVASWRPVPSLCDVVDRACHDRRLPFVPVIVDAAELCVGPVVVPGRGPCWACWALRLTQHARWGSDRSLLLQHYAVNHEAGPQGHFAPFATMGAARVSQILDSPPGATLPAGHVWQIDMITREITTSTVVGVHDCPRCGRHLRPRERTFSEMQQRLAPVWADGAPL